MEQPSPGGLWRNREFLKLWSAQGISLVGSKITMLALPLTALMLLEATPLQMGYLAAAGSLPALLFGLFAGVWVDRRARRPLLILADIARAGILLLIPLAVWLGALSMPVLYAIVFANGIFGLLFSVAYRSYLPTLVNRTQLVEANSKLEISGSAAEILGPGLAGWLVQTLTAPVAIVVDGVSFLLSALGLALIRQPEPPPATPGVTERIWSELWAGLRLVTGNATLRGLMGCTTTASFFNAALETVAFLYFTRHLGLTAGQIGLIFGAGSIGFLLGAFLPGHLTRLVGFGPSLILGLVILAVSDLIVPLVSGAAWVIVGVLMGAQFFFGLGLTFYNIGQLSLRQALTPDPLQGRMNAAFDLAVAGIVPLGALIGGALGEMIGVRAVLFGSALGELLAVGWLLWPPIPHYRVLPAHEATPSPLHSLQP
jgi:MFS family permease